jgi:hypothetical protein
MRPGQIKQSRESVTLSYSVGNSRCGVFVRLMGLLMVICINSFTTSTGSFSELYRLRPSTRSPKDAAAEMQPKLELYTVFKRGEVIKEKKESKNNPVNIEMIVYM